MAFDNSYTTQPGLSGRRRGRVADHQSEANANALENAAQTDLAVSVSTNEAEHSVREAAKRAVERKASE